MPINYHAFLFTALISLSTFGIVSFSFPPNPSAPPPPPTTTSSAPPTTPPPTTTPAPCTVANYSLTVGLTSITDDFYTSGFDQPRNLFVVAYNGNRVKLITPENVTIWDKETPCEGRFKIFMDGSSFYVNGRCTNSTNYIAKYNGAGDVQWLHQISYQYNWHAPILVNTSIIIVPDRRAYAHFHDSLTGTFIRNVTLTLDMSYYGNAGLFISRGFLYVSFEGRKTRFDGNGNEEFLFFMDPNQPETYYVEYGNSITIDEQGYMYQSGEENDYKAYVQKFSLNGTRIWYKILVTEYGNARSFWNVMGFPNIVVISDIIYSVGSTLSTPFGLLANTTLTTYNATNGNVILAIPNFLIGPAIGDQHFSNFMLTEPNFYILTNRGRDSAGSPITISGYCPP